MSNLGAAIEKRQQELAALEVRKEEPETPSTAHAPSTPSHVPEPPPKPIYLSPTPASSAGISPGEIRKRRVSLGTSKPLPAPPQSSSSAENSPRTLASVVGSPSSENLLSTKKPLPPAPLSPLSPPTSPAPTHGTSLPQPPPRTHTPPVHSPPPHPPPSHPPPTHPPPVHSPPAHPPPAHTKENVASPLNPANRRVPPKRPPPHSPLPSLPPTGASALPRFRCHLHTTADAEPVVRFVDAMQQSPEGTLFSDLTDLYTKINTKFETFLQDKDEELYVEGVTTQEQLDALVASYGTKYADLHLYFRKP